MVYYCTRCELDKLSHDTRRQAQNDDWVTLLYCRLCNSNTDHVAESDNDE
jgi:hypothetical protein